MSSGFESDDLNSFFETDGAAINAVISASPPAAPFTKNLNVIFEESSQAVGIYPETNVEANDPSFECKSTDLVGVKRGMQVVFPNLEAHEDGYQKTFEITRIASAGAQTDKVYLREI
jgi:hypothetical protein